jgi:hypothetical protein
MSRIGRSAQKRFSAGIKKEFAFLFLEEGFKVKEKRDVGSGRKIVVARSASLSVKFVDEMGRFRILVSGPNAPATWADESADGRVIWHSPVAICNELSPADRWGSGELEDPPETRVVLQNARKQADELQRQLPYLREFFHRLTE